MTQFALVAPRWVVGLLLLPGAITCIGGCASLPSEVTLPNHPTGNITGIWLPWLWAISVGVMVGVSCFGIGFCLAYRGMVRLIFGLISMFWASVAVGWGLEARGALQVQTAPNGSPAFFGWLGVGSPGQGEVLYIGGALTLFALLAVCYLSRKDTILTGEILQRLERQEFTLPALLGHLIDSSSGPFMLRKALRNIILLKASYDMCGFWGKLGQRWYGSVDFQVRLGAMIYQLDGRIEQFHGTWDRFLGELEVYKSDSLRSQHAFRDALAHRVRNLSPEQKQNSR